MNTPMDQFEVGQFVIQVEPIEWDREVGGFLGTGTVIKQQDRSYMNEPYKIVGVELPFVSVKSAREYPFLHVSIIDTRRHKLRVLSPEFVAPFLEKFKP